MPLDVICIILKAGGCLCVLGGCMGMGAYMCSGLFRRLEALKELLSLAMKMSGEIRCMSETMPVILRHGAEAASPVFKTFLQSVSDSLLKGQGCTMAKIWSSQVDRHLTDRALSGEDLLLIRRLGSNLGSHDVKMQLLVLELFMEEVRKSIGTLEGNMAQKRRMYAGLWGLGGAFIVLVFL